MLISVQSCWNGVAILDPAPFYQPPHVKFRMARLPDGECSASECSLICSEYHYIMHLPLHRTGCQAEQQMTTGLPGTVESLWSPVSSSRMTRSAQDFLIILLSSPPPPSLSKKEKIAISARSEIPLQYHGLQCCHPNELTSRKSTTSSTPSAGTLPPSGVTSALEAYLMTLVPIPKIGAGTARTIGCSRQKRRPR